MSTYINVTGDDGGLLERVKGQQRAARFSFNEQQRLSKVQEQIKQEETKSREQGRKLPVQPFKRELYCAPSSERWFVHDARRSGDEQCRGLRPDAVPVSIRAPWLITFRVTAYAVGDVCRIA